MPFDISLLPLYRSQAEIRPKAPGILLFEPPRRVERARSAERLLCYLTYQGDAAPEAETERLLQEVQATYYATSGSTTAALRAAALHLNRLLLERNFALRSQKRQGFGLLILMALRPEQAIWIQGGAVHILIWEQGNLRHVHDAELSAGLGYNQTPAFRYGQLAFQAGQRLLLCGVLPPGWHSLSLAGSLPSLYRHLMVLESREIHALLMGIEEGAGTVKWFPLPSLTTATGASTAPSQQGPGAVAPTPSTAAGEALSRAHYIGQASQPPSAPAQTPGGATTSSLKESASQPAVPSTPPASQPASSAPSGPAVSESASHPAVPPTPPADRPVMPTEDISATAETSSSEGENNEVALSGEATLSGESPSAYALPGAAASAPGAAPTPQSHPEGARQAASPLDASQARTQASPRTRLRFLDMLKPSARALIRLLDGYRQVRQKGLEALGKFLPHLLPTTETPLPLRTQGLLLLLAIAIPLLVATAAMVTYFRFGSSLEYEMYLRQAQGLRAQALSATDAVAQRDAWQGVLFYAEKAESYRRTSETQALRQEAEKTLQQLLGVVQLRFQPALSEPLPAPISRMVSVRGDLYLLDAQNGRVLRAMNDRGRLRLDEGFQCAPGTYGNLSVGALVDLLPLPDFNFYGATVLATDASGMLLYCAPDISPQVVALPRPNANWTRLTAFALDGDTLYVLDAPSRAIWEYTGYQSKFERPPRFVFHQEVPPIENGIDLVALQDTLYVLHASGTLTTCVNSRLQGVPTRCQSPASLHDPYPAHQGLAEFQEVHLAQITLGTPPAMPLLFLDDEHQAIYRFSSRSLELQEVWKAAPLSLPDLRWTAFTVEAGNVLYLAVEDRIYFARLP